LRAVDPHEAAARRARLGMRGQHERAVFEFGGHGKAAIAPARGHVGRLRAAQAASGREQRNRFEHIGLARAVLAHQHVETRKAIEPGGIVVAELAQGEAGKGHGRGALEHRAKKWEPVFRIRRCDIKNACIARKSGNRFFASGDALAWIFHPGSSPLAGGDRRNGGGGELAQR
jgi:hypothetical protein